MQLTSVQPGIVYGMYLYGCPGCTNNPDEIDIELVTNLLQPGAPLRVELNRFTSGSSDSGDGGLVTLPDGFNPLAAHDWTINWSRTKIDYLLDGIILASVSDLIPQSALRANELAFGPNSNWGAAYSASLQPVGSAFANQSFVALLTSVTISDSAPEPSTWVLMLLVLPVLYWLHKRKILHR